MIPEPILILGRTGQVGRALSGLAGVHAIVLGREEADLAHPASLPAALNKLKPGCIINAAAYTAVDRAEEEPELAMTVNAEAPAALAEYAFRHGIPFVHYSTDYVFPGKGKGAYTEKSKTAPINGYGRSKLAGEQNIRKAAKNHKNAQWLIFRTSWVYDAAGKNFLNTMLRLGREKETLRVVADQAGAPSYALDIARFSLRALAYAVNKKRFPSGIYHLCNAGETTWHGFAEAIFREASNRGMKLAVRAVRPITTSEYPTLARRPHNSRLSMKKLEQDFGIIVPDWEDALERCMAEKTRQEKEFVECVA